MGAFLGSCRHLSLPMWFRMGPDCVFPWTGGAEGACAVRPRECGGPGTRGLPTAAFRGQSGIWVLRHFTAAARLGGAGTVMFVTGWHTAGMLAGSPFLPQERLPAEMWLPRAARTAPTGVGILCGHRRTEHSQAPGSHVRTQDDGREASTAGLTDRWNFEGR